MQLIDILRKPEQFWQSEECQQLGQKIGLDFNELHKQYFMKVCSHLEEQYDDPERQFRICNHFFRSGDLDLSTIEEARGYGFSIKRFAPTSDRLNFNISNFGEEIYDEVYHCYPDEGSWGQDGFIDEDNLEQNKKLVDLCFKFGQLFEPYVQEKCHLFYSLHVKGYVDDLDTWDPDRYEFDDYENEQEAALELSFYVYLYL